MKELSEEQREYLSQRGFEMVKGNPGPDTEFPHVTLDRISHTMARSEISYHITKNMKIDTFYQCHPSLQDEGYLVPRIEGIVIGEMGLDGIRFTTEIDKPIRIFVQDAAWESVAQNLVDKWN